MLGCTPAPPAPLRSQTYLIETWHHVEESGDIAPGVDIDGRASTGWTADCTDALDYYRDTASRNTLVDAPGCGGRDTLSLCRHEAPTIDNQYAALLLGWLLWGPTRMDLRGEIVRQMASGVGLVGLEVVVDEDDENFPLVHLLNLELVSPRRRTLRATRVHTMGGAVYQGQLVVGFPDVAIPMGTLLGLRTIHRARFELPIEDGALRAGQFGGGVTLETVAEVARRIDGRAWDATSVRSLALPDLEPDRAGDCQLVSIGLGVELVPISPTL